MPRAHVVGVSIPRSGHHFLVSLLRETFGAAFRYCEFYTPRDCCRSLPCTRGGDEEVFFQKNHDLELAVPTDLRDVVYAVQYRDPVMALLSDREYLATMEGEERAGDRDEYVVWLGRKAFHFDRFFDKWLRPARPHDVRIDYDDLVADPAGVLQRLCTACGCDVPRATLAAAVERAAPTRAFFPPRANAPQKTPFVRRAVDTSRFYDAALLPAVESLLLDRIGELAAKRRLERADYRGHPVACVFFAEDARRRGDLAAALEQIDRAIASEPRNAHLVAERCDALCALGRVDDAVAAAARAVELAPANVELLRRLSDVHVRAARSHLADARRLAELLVELRPDDPGSRVHLAYLLLQLGETGGAQLHANRALQLGSRDPDAWRVASEIFASCQNWPAAIEAVRGAIAIKPAFPEYHHHLANLLTLAGRNDEAEAEHRRAIALAPDRPGWRWKLAEDLRLAHREADALVVVREALTAFPDHPSLRALSERLAQALG
jgi:tetratricopeptide (TPR) repeat protein